MHGTFISTLGRNPPPFAAPRSRTLRRRRLGLLLPVSAAGSSSSSSGGDADHTPPPPSNNTSSGNVFPLSSWGLMIRAVALHAAHLTARFLVQPLQPAAERLKAHKAAQEIIKQAAAMLHVDNFEGIQDLCSCLVLSETVYKIVDQPISDVLAIINHLKAAFPPGTVVIKAVQWASPHVKHRFVLAEGPDAIYVAFMGTKLPRDYLTNVVIWREQVDIDAALLSSDDPETVVVNSTTADSLAAHRGFVSRARGVPIHALYEEARSKGKRLVLTGHSLGGAVAQLCTLDLLQKLSPEQYNTVSCYGFATPALGNDALAKLVSNQGWKSRIRNYLMPEDPIPGLLTSNRALRSTNGSIENNNVKEKINTTAIPESAEQEPAMVGSASGGFPGAFAAAVAAPPVRAVTSTAANAVRGAARFAGEMSPMRVAQQYQPLGQQLYVQLDGVKRCHHDRPIADSVSQLEQQITTNPRMATAASEPTGERHIEDDDNVDVAAATQQQTNGKATAAQKQLFSMHRMASYRSRVLALCREAFSDLPAPLNMPFLPPLEHLAAVNAQRVVATELLAPGMFPLKATVMLPTSAGYKQAEREQQQDSSGDHKKKALKAPARTSPIKHGPGHGVLPRTKHHPRGATLAELRQHAQHVEEMKHDTAHVTTHAGAEYLLQKKNNGRWRFPWGVFGRKDSPVDDSLVEVVVRIEGRGLSNVTSAWVSGPPLHPNGENILTRMVKAMPVFQLPKPNKKRDPLLASITSESETEAAEKEANAAKDPNSKDSNDDKHDAVGPGLQLQAEIIRKPKAPHPSSRLSSRPRLPPVLQPLASFMSWLAVTAGWVALLQKLQPAGVNDYILAKVKIPARLLTEAQTTSSIGAAVHEGQLLGLPAGIGVVPRLVMHLQSDFSELKVPLEIRAGSDIYSQHHHHSGDTTVALKNRGPWWK